MTRQRRLRPFPSYRNLNLYHEVAYERRTQNAVAAQFGITQCRVSQIARRVCEWVDSRIPARHFRNQPGLRLHLALANERLRLADAYDPLIEIFLGDDDHPRFIQRYLTVVDGQPLNTVEISDQPSFRLWKQMADIQGRLAELEAIANRGPFADLPKSVKQTITREHPPVDDPSSEGPSPARAAATPQAPSAVANQPAPSPATTTIEAVAPSPTVYISPSIDSKNRSGGYSIPPAPLAPALPTPLPLQHLQPSPVPLSSTV